ncbi:MAG: UDP-N-acetylmuramate--L-alanine ligase [Gemmatimonadaceae bacterium]|nr:UDP-N-acetylmuramate--L-alanine ligase [Gemmatimonadaceae bacterium]
MTQSAHFVGVAGAGMRALAELYARRGITVNGCDSHPESAADLAPLGITILTGHSPSHLEGVHEVVVTSAMPKDHPELARARELGIPVTRRAEALGKAISGGKVVAIAGTHGKTTTTVLTTSALSSAGLQPTGIAGGRVESWGGNLSYQGDSLFVVEADEYDRSFLALAPDVAVITNVEADHLDIYRDLADIEATFATFARPASTIVLCADDAGANRIPCPPTAEIIRYGVESSDARLRATDVRLAPSGAGALATSFQIIYDDKPLGEVILAVPGMHNVLNSLAAIAAGIALGVSLDAMRPGLAAFAGVSRRFERIGDFNGITIIDDYAHHPTEITATLAAARVAFPGRRIIAAFQPHLFSRTRDFASEFAGSLCAADAIFLADIYPAREQPIEGVTSALIVDHLRKSGRSPEWTGARTKLAEALRDNLRSGDVLLTIGAGDITLTAGELRDRLHHDAGAGG